mgnify:CR=1 FL=1
MVDNQEEREDEEQEDRQAKEKRNMQSLFRGI